MASEIVAARPAAPQSGTRQPMRSAACGNRLAKRFAVRVLLCSLLVGAWPPLPDALTNTIPGASRGPLASAQASDTDDGFVSGTGDSSDSDGGGGEKSSGTRSIFLSLFATHFIPGIAEGLSNWFNRRMFGGEGSPSGAGDSETSSAQISTSDGDLQAGAVPIGALPTGANALAPAMAPAAAAGPTLHAGVAYEVLLLGSGGDRRSVDAHQHIFRSGEQFEVAYRPNFPGRVEVYNIDPSGRVTLIDRLTLQAAELGTLGPYEFVGEKGEDLLRIVLHPCRAPATTRNIRRIEMRKEVDRVLGDCADAEGGKDNQAAQVATRSIAKVAREGSTNYALDPVQKSELDSGKLQPREIIVRFRHE